MTDIETSSSDPGSPDDDGLPDLPPVGELVAQGLELLELRGEESFEEFCRGQTEHGDEVRRAVHALAGTGLVGGGRRFGHHRVLRPLGRGGMGVVYLAEDTRLSRIVALKALPSQLVGSERALERFRREARAVAGLRHPCIVPVHDVGEDGGQPYFTMEYVDGRTLDAVISALRGLGRPAERLASVDLARAAFTSRSDGAPAGSDVTVPRAWGRAYVQAICRLVLDVADALEHAHAHGIVHRDVKPSNVLVGRDGRAQLFDFGLARSELATPLTQTGDFTGTPYYVSPEQAAAGEIDARSDVFSLGVTLYELLTLTRPFEGRTNHEVFTAIHRAEPVALRRRNPAVPRDLETICLTALEKDPARRYPSAAALAADLLRFLDYRPVHVKPVGRAERVRRWARRNPGAATAAGLALFVLLALPVGLYLHGRALGRANDDLAASNASLERANRINTAALTFLVDVFGAADPSRGSADVTVAETLDDASARAGVEFADEPEVEAALRTLLGHSYEGIGRFARAAREYERALELRREVDDGDSIELRAALSDVGVVFARLGRLDDARAVLDEAREVAERLGDALPVSDRADGHFNVASLAYRAGDDARAEDHARAALELRRERLDAVDDGPRGEAAEDVAAVHVLLGNLARRRLDEQAAEGHYRRALERLEAERPDAVRTAIARSELASLYEDAGRWDEAEALFAAALDASVARRGTTHPATAGLRVDHARTLVALGEPARALDELSTAEAALPPDDDAAWARLQRTRASALADLDRLDEAADAAADALPRARASSPPGSFADVDAVLALADIATRAGRRDDAIGWLDDAADRAASANGEQHWTVAACRERADALRH